MTILAFIFWVVIALFASGIVTHRKDTQPKNKVHFYVARDKKEKFDPNTLKPFDKVLVRISNLWRVNFFSNKEDGGCRCIDINYSFKYCIPYNDETRHLVGTTEEAPEYYRYWED